MLDTAREIAREMYGRLGARWSALALAVVAGLVAVTIWSAVGGSSAAPAVATEPVTIWDPPSSSVSTTTIAPLVVHVAGAVQSPGLYRLPRGARVVDAVEAAGGVADGIDIDRVNLAAPLVDGQHLVLPRQGQAVPGGPAGAVEGDGTTGPAMPLDLNVATSAQLEALPGVGPATAAAIIAQRDRMGGFGSVEDLRKVKGIGDGRLAALRDLVTVG